MKTTMRIDQIETDPKLNGLGISASSIEVDMTRIIEHAFFENEDSTDYRNDSINFMVKRKIDCHSTCNSIHNFISKFVKISCPNCQKDMSVHSSGGNNNSHTTTFRCSCGTKFYLATPNDGLSIEFKEEA